MDSFKLTCSVADSPLRILLITADLVERAHADLDMRVALRLPSASDSQVILDKSGAEDLGGNGDLLFREVDSLTRLQGAYVDTSYLREVIEKVSGQ